MSTDKTLADAQPGGMVRLGDQAERARFEAWAISRGWSIQRWAEGAQRYCNCDTERMWEAFQAALAAQPSPGGQVEDAVEQLRVQLAGCGVVAMSNTRESLKEQMPDKGAYGWSESLQQVWESVLREIHQRERAEAAEQALEMAASSLPANVLQQIAGFFYDGPYRNPKMVDVMEAALAARQPVGEPVFRERSTHKVYRGSCGNLPCHCWADTDHIVGDEVKRYATQPAQAVDLSTLERFECQLYENPWPYSKMDEVDGGDWVRFDDVKSLIDSNSNS